MDKLAHGLWEGGGGIPSVLMQALVIVRTPSKEEKVGDGGLVAAQKGALT